ncbi:MAG: protease [Chlamydiae bacterium]|nr:MAG: protease [Chlamydiota bacterium]
MKAKPQKILLFVADEYEDLELQYPKYRLREAGKKVVVAGEKKESYKGKHGYPCLADAIFKEVKVEDFDALVIPGGYAPDKLRKIPKVLEITKKFANQKKLIAFICHAGWIPISAKILKGIRCTSYISIKEDILNAGGKWVDKSVVIDRHFISSRFPEDLPDFCSAILHYLSQG